MDWGLLGGAIFSLVSGYVARRERAKRKAAVAAAARSEADLKALLDLAHAQAKGDVQTAARILREARLRSVE